MKILHGMYSLYVHYAETRKALKTEKEKPAATHQKLNLST